MRLLYTHNCYRRVVHFFKRLTMSEVFRTTAACAHDVKLLILAQAFLAQAIFELLILAQAFLAQAIFCMLHSRKRFLRKLPSRKLPLRNCFLGLGKGVAFTVCP